MRNAFAPPKKGETFELRAGLVYVLASKKFPHILTRGADLSMPTKGSTIILASQALSDLLRRKESIQKTIMAMTLGKDVSALFPDVLKNIATADLDQKKLVYLYLM